MSDYIFFYRGGQQCSSHVSLDHMQYRMRLWMDWLQTGFESGWMLDAGNGFTSSGAIVDSDLSVKRVNEFGAQKSVDGYSLVQAHSINRAIELAQECPMAKSGGTVEIRELLDLRKQNG